MGFRNDDVAEEIRQLFDARGDAWYGGEAVSQREHALQSAMFAESEGASADLIVAALLHDVGHVLHTLPEDAAGQGIDDRHERLGQVWLERRFGPSVAEPVALHVAAKRYLCAVDGQYRSQLSPASELSLQIQGGPMSDEEAAAFERHAFFADAVRLRRWDDRAKVAGLATPPLEHYLAHVPRLCRKPNL